MLVYIFYGPLVYFIATLYIFWWFGSFFPFWYIVPRKIWQHWSDVPSAAAKMSTLKVAQHSPQSQQNERNHQICVSALVDGLDRHLPPSSLAE
jgi:hypothetical protein